MSSIVNQTPYLKTTRNFPEEAKDLSYEMDKSYLEIAGAVNNRTIGIYPTNAPSVTGNSYFVSKAQKQQSLRQVYSFGAVNAGASTSIPIASYHAPYVLINGACQTSLPDSRPLPYASVAANSNIDIRVDKTSKTIVVSVGAASPNVVSGYIILEWLSAV